MRLLEVRVLGFQSFQDSGAISFKAGINLIVGPNNVGKSAFLRALQPTLPDDRHKTPAEWRDDSLPTPLVSLRIEVPGSDIKRAAFEAAPIVFPAPHGGDENPIQYVTRMLDGPNLVLKVEHLPASNFTASYPSHGQFVWAGSGQATAARIAPNNGKLDIQVHFNGEDTLPAAVYHLWRTKMFYFSAERFSIGQAATAHTERLDANASNLAAVLATLSGDRGDTFDKLVAHLREIFPTVGNLSTRIQPGNASMTEIRVWPTAERSNVRLSFPLTQSGTGVAQTVAIMTVDDAVIMIDEINSFLHPAAVKALLRILQTEYAHHQYIISTHATEVVGFSNPSTLHLVKRSGYVSTIHSLDPNQVSSFREVSSHLGVSMADVFAADRVIWVEGETEETLFPYLYREVIGAVPRGTIFTTVAATGDFGAKRRDRPMVYDAYTRLSAAVATLPVKVVFGFDTETLSEPEKQEMTRDSGGRLHFLPRWHVECYLLDPESIARRIRDKDPGNEADAKLVTTELHKLGSDRFAVRGVAPDVSDEIWLSRVDAARMLSKLFSTLSETRIEYDKAKDGIELAKLILARDPGFLNPLLGYVRDLVNAVQAD